jgi:hypothetical protein
MTPMERYSTDRVREAICRTLYERGPITAKYSGQAIDLLAERMNKVLPRRHGTPWSRSVVAKFVNMFEDEAMLRVTPSRADEPNRQVLREIRYIGGDPDVVQWQTPKPLGPRPERRTVSMERLDALERKIATIEAALIKYGFGEDL